MSDSNQFQLLKQRRFLPFFITQFLGAFNDNLYKNALVIMISFSSVKVMGANSDVLINFAAVLFILPFFLFSAIAGQLADKFDNATLMRYVKLSEIIIMLMAAIGFYYQSYVFLLLILFLMGTQSAFFGPVKYGYLPRVLHRAELVGGNGMTDMGTFVAILLGMIAGAHTISLDNGELLVSAFVLICAGAGYLSAKKIPHTHHSDPKLSINYNIFTETWKIIRYSRTDRTVFLSIISISWFWFFGSIFITQIPNYTRHYISGDESVFILLMGVFSVSVGIGSLLCEKLSGGRVEMGLVPLGSIGLSLFSMDFYLSANQPVNASQLITVTTFLQNSSNWRVLFDFFMIGVSSGFYIVPLYALIQARTRQSHVSRVIASNNILNALFMVIAGIAAMLLLGHGISIPELMLITALLNILVASYVYKNTPEFLWRLIVWLSKRSLFRIKETSVENIPPHGAALLLCDQVKIRDALIIAACIKQPVRFVVDEVELEACFGGFVLRLAQAIPMNLTKQSAHTSRDIATALDAGELVCIPTGVALKSDGDQPVINPLIEKILKSGAIPIIPITMETPDSSHNSPNKGKSWSEIKMKSGKMIASDQVSAKMLYNAVQNSGDQW